MATSKLLDTAIFTTIVVFWVMLYKMASDEPPTITKWAVDTVFVYLPDTINITNLPNWVCTLDVGGK